MEPGAQSSASARILRFCDCDCDCAPPRDDGDTPRLLLPPDGDDFIDFAADFAVEGEEAAAGGFAEEEFLVGLFAEANDPLLG